MSARTYLPLEDYALIGDGRGAALVGRDGSLDWMCVPRFDSPSVFGGLLDHRIGGAWRLGPTEPAASTMRYRADTAVVETEHRTSGGVVLVSDCFVLSDGTGAPGVAIRLCEGLTGRVELESVVEAAPDFARAAPLLESWGDDGLLVAHLPDPLRLRSSIGRHEQRSLFTLEQGERAAFLLEWGTASPRLADAPALIESTAVVWRSWCSGLQYEGPYADVVTRSGVTLKLLTYEPTGGSVAAPSSSLPAVLGGDANWDYRYTWLRDSALIVYALLAVGARDEGDAFIDWICARVGEAEEQSVHTMYDVDGGFDHDERSLPHLEGYEGSTPVRVGNAACTQVQIDVYGEVLELFAAACEWGRPDKLSLWNTFRPLADWICEHWTAADSGIWEQRGPERHYVHSKVMAWVALDRARRVALRHGLDGDLRRWESTAAAIRHAVLERGWDEQHRAFGQSFEEPRADAASLLVPLVGFLPSDDARVLANLDRVREELETDGLVRRFLPREDELSAGEGPFMLCSFWLVNAMAAAGRTEEAIHVFERACARSSPTGLFAEHLEPAGVRLLGNYPQAFVHAGAISAAVNLARAGVGDAPAATAAPAGIGHLIPLPTDRPVSASLERGS